MASNGVILLNLNNRNAADFQRLEVPEAYEKASGALTAGTYVTVYKWLYEGFMLAPSLCDAVDADGHINLVDRTNGGILEVYPDDTVNIAGGLDFPEFDMGGVDFVSQSLGPSNMLSLISDAVEVSFIVTATNFSVDGISAPATPTSVSKFKDSDNQTFYTMENEFFKYSASENPFGQSYVEFHIKEAPSPSPGPSPDPDPDPDPDPEPMPSAYNGYRIRLGHVTGMGFYDPYIVIRQANVVSGVEQSVGGDSIYFKPSLSFSVGGNDYTAAFYDEYNQGEFGMFLSYIGSGLVEVRLYSEVSGLSYCRVPQSGSPVINSLPDRSSSTIVKFDVPSNQDWIDILVWRNNT